MPQVPGTVKSEEVCCQPQPTPPLQRPGEELSLPGFPGELRAAASFCSRSYWGWPSAFILCFSRSGDLPWTPSLLSGALTLSLSFLTLPSPGGDKCWLHYSWSLKILPRMTSTQEVCRCSELDYLGLKSQVCNIMQTDYLSEPTVSSLVKWRY